MKNSSTALCESLPYWEMADEPFSHVILSDGSVSSGFEILPMDIECFDEGRINSLAIGLRAFANSLPDGVTFQFLIKVQSDLEEKIELHQKLRTSTNSFLTELDDKRCANFMEQAASGELFSPKLFFFVKTAPTVKPSSFAFSKILKFSKEVEVGFEERMQVLSQTLESTRAALSSLGFTTFACSKKQFSEILYEHLNPNRSEVIMAPDLSRREQDNENTSLRSQIVFGDMILENEDFILDSRRTRVICLKTLPEVTFAGMMSGFLSFPFKYDLIFSFTVPDQDKEIKSLEQKRRMAHSLSSSSDNRVSDLESESRLVQTTELLREIIETGQKIFRAELLVILRGSNNPKGLKELNLHTKEVLNRFKTLSGSEGMQETVGSWKIFKSDLPLAPSTLIREKKMKTNNLVDFFPLYGASSGDKNPVCLLKTRLGTLYSIDPYSSRLSNFNSLATGSSGSGKSFANNFLMLQQIARGTKVFIIDIGGSYRKMTELLKGQYFEISLSGKYKINPFELRDPSNPPNGERLKGLVSIVEQMVVDQGEKLTRFERVQLEAALTSVFESARKDQPPRSPILTDLALHCLESSEEVLQKIGKMLFPWTGNTPFGKMLDGTGQMEADRSIVAFDLKGLSQYPDLQSVMILILTNFILEQVESDRTVQKRVLLDEAWELLKSPAASSFMEYAARTFRKMGSGITFITQGVEEILTSGMGPAILNNTATKLIMLQKGDIKVLKDTLKLNTQEIRLIQSLEQRKGTFSEGFLMEGESRQVIRIQPSPIEYWISTSDSRDNQFLESKIKKGLSLEEAVTEAASEAPYGVASLVKVAA